MPPTSRGVLGGSHCVLHFRTYASISKPRDPRGFLNRVQSKAQPRVETPAPGAPSAEQPPPKKWMQKSSRYNVGSILLRSFHGHSGPGSSMITFVFWMSITGFALYHFPFHAIRVTGPSMSPTMNADCISNNDINYKPTWILLKKWGIGTFRALDQRLEGQTTVTKYSRGDIVAYMTPHDPEKLAVKRVVGIAGDRVTPIDGDDAPHEAVVIPYHHVWVEGDVGDRKKSLDSNYFGPLSVAMITGQVIAIWRPWWNIFGIRSADSHGDWPAKRQGRVEENAVEEASADPQQVDLVQRLGGQSGLDVLRMLDVNSASVKERFYRDEDFQNQMKRIWIHAKTAARGHPDVQAKQQAKEVAEALEEIIGKEALLPTELSSLAKRRRHRRGELHKDAMQEFEERMEEVYAQAAPSSKPDGS